MREGAGKERRHTWQTTSDEGEDDDDDADGASEVGAAGGGREGGPGRLGETAPAEAETGMEGDERGGCAEFIGGVMGSLVLVVGWCFVSLLLALMLYCSLTSTALLRPRVCVVQPHSA